MKPPSKLNEQERLDWIQLIRTPMIGPITFHRLLAKYITAAEAIEALPEISQKAGRKKPFVVAARIVAEREQRLADQHGVKIIAACEPEYPEALKAVPDHPPVLYLRGDVSVFQKPAIAIVGARNASGVGRKIARSLASDLGAADVVIASGLARGIDAAAHEASLNTGTIAVVAGGVDVIYPPEHEILTNSIAKSGIVVSECPMGYQPTARDFPKRNRLISGLSRGVIVVEAAERSGTLITARCALEQGREVFAVPGSPLDPRCRGANRLIRDGAMLVESAEDVLKVLAEQSSTSPSLPRDLFGWSEDYGEENPDENSGKMPDKMNVRSVRENIIEILSYTPLHRDEILREVNASPGLVAEALLELILTDVATEHSGGRYSLAASD